MNKLVPALRYVRELQAAGAALRRLGDCSGLGPEPQSALPRLL